MLCFVFAALVVVLDQFIKHWVMLTIELQGQVDLIPGVIELTHFQNSGAAFSILADQRWLLAGISFVAAVALIFILLRYTEGFWGTLGLAAVLGGTVGNLIDRVFQGYVVDMFKPLFIEFAIFNIADTFLTLGFITFCIHFIGTSIKSSKQEEALAEAEEGYEEGDEDEDEAEGRDEDPYSIYDVPDRQDAPVIDNNISDTKVLPVKNHIKPIPKAQPEPPKAPVGQLAFRQPEPEVPDDIAFALDALEALDKELSSIEGFDTDALLREYGFEIDGR